MSITFYYGSGSPYAWKVWYVLEHKSLPYELKRLHFSVAELRSPAFLAINPRGKVPAIVDEEVTLYESNAIVEYLEERYPERSVLGSSNVLRARSRRIAAEVDHYLYPLQRELFVQTLFRPVERGRDAAAIAKAHEALLAELVHWERSLAAEHFFGGDEPLLPDYAAFPVLRGIRRVDEREPEHGLGDRTPPWLRSYLDRMESLEITQKTWPPHWRE
jgi:glutathione S-transferase